MPKKSRRFMRAPLARNSRGCRHRLDRRPDGSRRSPIGPVRGHGPREIRKLLQSHASFSILALGVNPYELCRGRGTSATCACPIGTISKKQSRGKLRHSNRVVHAGRRAAGQRGRRPLDHIPPIFPRRFAADAPHRYGTHRCSHRHLGASFFGSKFTHGAPFRLAVEDGLLESESARFRSAIRGGQKLHGRHRVLFCPTACAWCSWRNSRRAASSRSSKRARRVVGDGPTLRLLRCGRPRSRVRAGHRHAR